MMQDFIEYAGTHRLDYDNDTQNVHLHYDKWPIDIISFSGLNQYGNSWENIVNQTRGWLTNNGYSANIPILVQESGTWVGRNYLDSRRDSEFISSYIINQIGWWDRANINDHYFTTLFDFRTSGTQEFIGRNDLWTSHYVIKPIYNAFKTLSILGGKQEGENPIRLKTNFNDNDFVTAIASQTQDKSKTRIFLSNFLPTGSMVNQFIQGIYRSYLLSKGYTLTDADFISTALAATYTSKPPPGGISGFTLNNLTQIINQTDFSPFNNTQVRADLVNCSPQVVQKLSDLTYYTANPRQVDIVISGLSFSGAATLTAYTIDKGNSNSCKANKATESSPTSTICGINGVIDRAVQQGTYAIDQINTNPNLFIGSTNITVPIEGSKKEKQININGGTYSKSITMQPYSVVLLEISGVADTNPPVISSVSASSITSNSATITWTTNEASDSQVEYGLTASYGSQTVLNTSPVTSHSQNISGLTANTTYHYRVKSSDAAGNLATSADYTFTTAATR